MVSPENALNGGGGGGHLWPIMKFLEGFCRASPGDSISGVVFSKRRVDSLGSRCEAGVLGLSRQKNRGRRSCRHGGSTAWPCSRKEDAWWRRWLASYGGYMVSHGRKKKEAVTEGEETN